MQSQLDSAQSSLSEIRMKGDRQASEVAEAKRMADKFEMEYSNEKKNLAAVEVAYEDQQVKLSALIASQKRRISELESSVGDMDRDLSSAREEAKRAEASSAEAVGAARVEVEALKKQLAEKQRNPNSRSVSVNIAPRQGQGGPTTASSAASAAVAVVEGGLSFTDVYNEMVLAQELLAEEKDRSANLEATLERITLEFEAKVPVMLRQKKEREEALENVRFMSERLEAAERFVSASKARAEELADESLKSRTQLKALKGENRDLALQVQTLLKSRMQHAGGGQSVAAEMQRSNQKLLSEVNSLRAELEAVKGMDETREVRARLASAVQELTDLREERSKQETIVSAIVSQRDMYR